MSNPTLFDLSLLDAHRRRALARAEEGADFLWQIMAEQVLERLEYVKRNFAKTLYVGMQHETMDDLLAERFGIEQLLNMDSLPLETPSSLYIQGREDLLPIKPGSLDLLLSIGTLQWANDLPGTLMQMHRALKPDGLLLARLPGEETLIELRASLDHAMVACYGGIHPRISPMLGFKDGADLLQRAGYALPVADRHRIQVAYSSPLKLMHDLRAMGQTNALTQRSTAPLTRKLLAHMVDYYQQNFPHPEGGVCATFDLITFTGWTPHASQAQPLRRGSGQVSMQDVL